MPAPRHKASQLRTHSRVCIMHSARPSTVCNCRSSALCLSGPCSCQMMALKGKSRSHYILIFKKSRAETALCGFDCVCQIDTISRSDAVSLGERRERAQRRWAGFQGTSTGSAHHFLAIAVLSALTRCRSGRSVVLVWVGAFPVGKPSPNDDHCHESPTCRRCLLKTGRWLVLDGVPETLRASTQHQRLES